MGDLQFSNTATMSFGYVQHEAAAEHEIGSTGTQWSTVVPLVRLSEAQAQGLKRLLTIRKLPHNWDSYNSPPPTEAAIHIATLILAGLDFEEFPIPRINPVSGGGVHFEWDRGSRELELEVLNDGLLTYLKVENDEAIDEHQGLGPNLSQVRALLSWLVS